MKKARSIIGWLIAKIPGHLPKLQGPLRRARMQWLYAWLLKLWENSDLPVLTELHGFPALLNGGNNYPFIIRSFPSFNAPLVEICNQLASVTKRPLVIVDVGAAVGDSVLLLKERCPGMVGKFFCVEGDPEFLSLLTQNMAQFDDVQTIGAMLAREAKMTPSLVKHHKGTASAIGESQVGAVRLDSISFLTGVKIDLLKIDVDGFDGEVLAGSRSLLLKHRPAVIFEWHPMLVARTQNDPTVAFSTLAECGYSRYLWFKNCGTFSHFTEICSAPALLVMAKYLISVNARADEHFDVVALTADSPVDDIKLASLNYAKRRAN